MGGPSNKINKPRQPGFRIIQRQKRNQIRANPPSTRKEKGTFSGGMSKHKKAKGIIKKRKFNVSTNSTPSGKKLRKLLKARLRDEKEANQMQVEFTSVRGKKQRQKTRPEAVTQPQSQVVDTDCGKDIEMQDLHV